MLRDDAMNVLLVNPNTNPDTTAMMVSIACKHAPRHWAITGRTLSQSALVINTPPLLETARQEMETLAGQGAFDGFDAVIVAAFGDPGLAALRATLAVPVVGIGEAAIQAAMSRGQPYAIVSITPRLAQGTLQQVTRVGGDALLRGVFYTADNAAGERPLADNIAMAANRALDESNVSTLIIAGGPLASIADRLLLQRDCHIVQPLPSAMRKLMSAAASHNKFQ
jgi:Asp/Glu/hydantoin racemase